MFRTWRLGIKSMLLHPLRSSLTVLGIFIGVASVIWLLAIGEGISRKAQEQISNLGADTIIVRSVKPSGEATAEQGGVVRYGVKRADYRRMIMLDTIDEAIPIREIRRQFRYNDQLVDGRLVGCTPEYAEVMRLEVARGHFVTDAEGDAEQNHCVLAAGTAEKLFPVGDPIGKTILAEDDAYVVVGVTEPRTPTAGIGGSLESQDFSTDVYIPYKTLRRRIDDFVATVRTGSFEGEEVQLSQVTLKVDDVDHVLETAAVIKADLEKTHALEDFAVVVPLELLEQARIMRLMFMIFLGVIAAVSLVVGGIGIMNIMLATVTERTREIGIRRALGAKQRDITYQFLNETIVLSMLGGLIGILAGLVGPLFFVPLREFAAWLFPEASATLPDVVRNVEPVLVPWSVPLAFMISVGVGIVFGLYPAVRAAALDPIEALRHE